VLPGLLTIVHAALHVEARYTLPGRATLLLLGGAALAAQCRRARRPFEPVEPVHEAPADRSMN
jgi:hypothetical protein